MALRATEALVAAIIEVDEDIGLSPFIIAANALVEDIAVDSGHTEERLTLIETWLAAHFYAMRDPSTIPTSERAGPVSASYQSAVALYLASSRYGQMALTLDSSGLLAAMSPTKVTRTASVGWAGREAHRGLVADSEAAAAEEE